MIESPVNKILPPIFSEQVQANDIYDRSPE